jgi:TolB-like protein
MLVLAAGFLVCLCGLPRAAADSPSTSVTLAVLEFSLNLDIANPDDAAHDGLPARLASQNLRRLASESRRYALVDGRTAAADSPCTDFDCALNAGRALGAQRVIWGQVTKASALIWFVSAQLVDVPTAMTLHAETLQFRGNMKDVVPRLAVILWRRMHEGA